MWLGSAIGVAAGIEEGRGEVGIFTVLAITPYVPEMWPSPSTERKVTAFRRFSLPNLIFRVRSESLSFKSEGGHILHHVQTRVPHSLFVHTILSTHL